MNLPLSLGLAALLLAGCGGRPPSDEDDARRAAADEALAAKLEASPLTKPALPPLAVPPHAVSAVDERTLAAQPAVAFVARRPNARTLQSAIDRATAELMSDPAVRTGVAGPLVVVRRGMAGDLDRPFELEVGVVVRPDVTPTAAGVKVRPLPAMAALAVTFAGPPAALDKAYDALLPEVRSRNLRPTGEVREVYAWREPSAADEDVDPPDADDRPSADAVEVLVAVGIEP